MAISFTPEQQKVIELHHCNILVSAAAGSGKTAVLVERIIRMVCDEEHPVDIDRLLIVTFTNAAAAEMRERIALGISAKLDEKPESEHIQKQAALLHNAQITTIDSFCLFLLRNHFNEIGLDPAFRVADEGEVKLMQQEVLQELIEDGYREGGESFRFCVEFFCHGGREKVLEQHILNLSRYAASFPFPEEWLLARKEDYRAQDAESVSGSHYGQYLLSYLQKMTAGCAEKLKRVGTLCEEPDGPYMYGELTEQETEQLERLAGCRSLSEFESRLPAVVFGRLPSKKDDSVSPVKRELAKKLRNEVKESLKKLEGRFFATPLELAAKQGYACMEPVGTLVDLVLEFDRRMGEKKQERKIIDFSDMEHFALKILLNREEGRIRPSAVALEYRQHLAEILIDEYQDSNLVQEYLLKAVSGEEEGRFNRFMVGDVKQSIYKFRLARPELFLEKYNTYCPEEGDCRRIDLAKNFRSRTQVVDAVNSVFSGIMSKDIGGIEYDERAALYPGAVYPENEGCESELLLVEKPDSNAEENAKRLEARAIARKIKELMGSFQVTEKGSGSLRPVRYSDLVILLRTNSGWDEEFKQVLEDEGIPVYITSKTGYFGATEVQELLQLLRVLDNPTQDIPLFGVMKSVFGGFTEEEIARLRSGKKSCSLYEAVKEYVSDLEAAGEKPEEAEGESQAAEEKPEEAEGESQAAGEKPEEAEGESQAAGEKLEEAEDRMLSVRGNCSRGCGGLEDGKNAALCRKAADFITMLERYREYTAYMPIRELLATLVTDFDYLNYVTALPAGGKRRANVEMLFTKASDFEKTSYFGLFHFIRYMEQLEKYDVDYGEAELLDENADVVRIMSIHKSKGLEFPVTFVAGLSKRFNIQDANQSMIADMDMGLATDYVDPERRIRNRTLRRAVLSVKLREDNLSEELRVLYVALTRAKEKLVMTASMENAREQWELWKDSGSERLAFLDYAEAGSYLDFLLPVLAKTCIRVSVINGEELEADAFKEQMSLHERKTRLEQAGKRIGKQTAVETERQVCQTAVETEKQVCQTETEEQVYQALKGRLRAVYAYENLSGLYTKTTVSELKIAAMADKDEAAYHTFEEKEVQPYIPLFRREQEKVSGTVRGNAYHRVMEILDLDLLMEAQPGEERKAALHGFLTEQVEENRLDREYFEAVREEKILRFLSSELGRRMYRAHREGGLFREQPFVIGIGADRLGQGFPEAETVLIQGIIDVFFVEEDGLVLLDYKTDSVRSMAELWNRYEAQMNYYQEALQKLMCRPVKERILYSFSLEKY
ncbi:MAG: UvrD-helicase domain-containing protein [Lachnospiraceae bacterium]|nr:UvrD-helicase domain-containing protein [Lachnospiraceae bacterium]